MMNRYWIILAVSVICLVSSCKKTAKAQSEEQETPYTIEQLAGLDSVSIWKHLVAIQKIAGENNNHRSIGSPGGIATADYIYNQLQAFDLNPVMLPFETEGKKDKKSKKAKMIKGQNIIVEIPGKSKDVVMFGAHYDSVEMGPGINDNATGVAILLQLANISGKADVQPERTIRIAFWDGEEAGVLGSAYYVKHLPDSIKDRIVSYVNVDMVGTKQPEIYVLDGDGSSLEEMKADMKKNGTPDKTIQETVDPLKSVLLPKLKKGSGQLEKLVADYLKSKDMGYKDDFFTSLSTDTSPFFEIAPTTGITMLNEQEEPGGVLLFAPCYHQACDTIENVDKGSFFLAFGLVAYLVDNLAFSY